MSKRNQTERWFQVLSLQLDDAIESGIGRTLSANKLASTLDEIKNSVNSALTDNRRLNKTATNGCELSGCRANNDFEENASSMTNSNLILKDRPTISWRVSEKILETLAPRGKQTIFT